MLAHAALERALNGVEVPVYYQGEQVGAYRRYDERLTVALLKSFTLGGNPAFGRLGPMAERHARDFEALLGRIEAGVEVETGAGTPDNPAELERLRRFSLPAPCLSDFDDGEFMEEFEDFACDDET